MHQATHQAACICGFMFLTGGFISVQAQDSKINRGGPDIGTLSGSVVCADRPLPAANSTDRSLIIHEKSGGVANVIVVLQAV